MHFKIQMKVKIDLFVLAGISIMIYSYYVLYRQSINYLFIAAVIIHYLH